MDFDKTKLLAVILLIVLVSFAISFAVYEMVPEKIITHWNAAGEADGYVGKDLGLFLLPVIGLGIAALLLAIPKIDPLKRNVQSFIKDYNLFIVVVLGFLLYIHIITVLINLGYALDIGQLLSPAMGILFYFAGILIGKTKRNYFVGIRTPWTLESDKVWEKTHEKGKTMFKASGIICFFGLLIPLLAIWFIIVPVIASSIYLVVYSYTEFKKEKVHTKK